MGFIGKLNRAKPIQLQFQGGKEKSQSFLIIGFLSLLNILCLVRKLALPSPAPRFLNYDILECVPDPQEVVQDRI